MIDNTIEVASVQLEEIIPFDCCPISKKIFRHPVIASDGYHYELIELLNQLVSGELLSFVTGEKITYIHYDFKLKTEIDQADIQNRYPDYDKQEYLKQLTKVLASPYIPWKQSIYKSSVTALITLITVCSITEGQEEISPSLLLSTLLLSGLADFCIHMSSNHRYGLFGGLNRAIKTVVDEAPALWETLCSIDPEELHF
ncbi:RING finger protein [Legionella fallonii]|uniref:U-box domain-containing protein n=1 Tax=Legionella fallonii LLAP-10 TaxID=1212491 RepID=A0A098G4M0_9GAMM|nr:hypothetical protein [Legionella fallonii]CEG56916.1 protein of unknown function [Legionella fallonii LLAP-10]